MAAANIGKIIVQWKEDSSAVIMCRLEDRPLAPDTRGAALLRADLTAIVYTVYDISGTTPSAVSGHNAVPLVIADVFFDTLQGWHVDSAGHNFRYTLPPAAFPAGSSGGVPVNYRVIVKWTHTDGRVGHTVWEGPASSVNDA